MSIQALHQRATGAMIYFSSDEGSHGQIFEAIEAIVLLGGVGFDGAAGASTTGGNAR